MFILLLVDLRPRQTDIRVPIYGRFAAIPTRISRKLFESYKGERTLRNRAFSHA